jgi:hypothetical protein
MADDFNADIAEAYDDAREEIAPGSALYLLRPLNPGWGPVPAVSDPNGEVFDGWLPVSNIRQGSAIAIEIVRHDDYDDAAMEQTLAIGYRKGIGNPVYVYGIRGDIEKSDLEGVTVFRLVATFTRETYLATVTVVRFPGRFPMRLGG